MSQISYRLFLFADAGSRPVTSWEMRENISLLLHRITQARQVQKEERL